MHADHAAGCLVCFVSILCSSYWKTVPFLHAAFSDQLRQRVASCWRAAGRRSTAPSCDCGADKCRELTSVQQDDQCRELTSVQQDDLLVALEPAAVAVLQAVLLDVAPRLGRAATGGSVAPRGGRGL